MKKPYMHTIIGSTGKYCVLITFFQLYGPRAGLVECDLKWVVQYNPPSPPPQPSTQFSIQSQSI